MNPNKISDAFQKQYHPVKETWTLDNHPSIQGYDFNQPFNFPEFLKAYANTGFQATNLAHAIEIAKTMQREQATIFLGFTSNMISSGIRETIHYLTKNKKVHVLVTSAGGIEEDIIKTFKPFALGQFDVPGKLLFEKGINRTGNIFVPNDRYAYFDKFMQTFLKEIHQKQKELQRPLCCQEFIRELGLKINDPTSVLYQAAKNNLPVFCPGIIDGSIGDLLVFYKQSHPDFMLDVSQDVLNITKIVLNADKTAAILLGGGIAKHFVLNANLFREGVDYAIYINTAQEFDGSDSGAEPEEAISWGKIKTNAPHVKIHADATIAFPLLVAGSFAQEE